MGSFAVSEGGSAPEKGPIRGGDVVGVAFFLFKMGVHLTMRALAPISPRTRCSRITGRPWHITQKRGPFTRACARAPNVHVHACTMGRGFSLRCHP